MSKTITFTDAELEKVEVSWKEYFKQQPPLIIPSPWGPISENITYFDLMLKIMEFNAAQDKERMEE